MRAISDIIEDALPLDAEKRRELPDAFPNRGIRTPLGLPTHHVVLMVKNVAVLIALSAKNPSELAFSGQPSEVPRKGLTPHPCRITMSLAVPTNHMTKGLTAMTMTDNGVTLRVGEQVRVEGYKFPGIWTISKVNSVNVKLEQREADAAGVMVVKKRLNCAPVFLLPVGDHPDDPKAVKIPNGIRMERTLPTQDPGSVVRYVGPTSGKIIKGAVFVVLADKWDKVNITPLGGNDGNYWRMPPRHLEAVDMAKVTFSVAS